MHVRLVINSCSPIASSSSAIAPTTRVDDVEGRRVGWRHSNASRDVHMRAEHACGDILFVGDDGGDSDAATVMCWRGDAATGRRLWCRLARPGVDVAAAFADVLEPDDARSIEPFSFALITQSTGSLWFAKDWIGHHSLLLRLTTDDSVSTTVDIAHTAATVDSQSSAVVDWIEIPPDGLFRVNLTSPDSLSHVLIHAYRMRASLMAMPISSSINVSSDQLEGWDNVVHQHLSSLRERQAQPTHHEEAALLLLNAYCDIFAVQLDALAHRLETAVATSAHSTMASDGDVVVLFSGGLDSTLVAHLLARSFNGSKCAPNAVATEDKTLVDLVNVAFGVNDDAFERVPDRMRAASAVSELVDNNNSGINLRLNKRNVDAAEVKTARVVHIRRHLTPSLTVLDDSIGTALWFAVVGSVSATSRRDQDDARPLLLLTGMGADELFAGYSSHWKAARVMGDADAAVELMCRDQLANLWSRNLGRDDRVILAASQCSDRHSRPCSSRTPFLDPDVVGFVTTTRLVRYDFRLARGLGDKLMLRALAFRYGLRCVATRQKQAIQFGTRIAQLDRAAERQGVHRTGADPIYGHHVIDSAFN